MLKSFSRLFKFSRSNKLNRSIKRDIITVIPQHMRGIRLSFGKFDKVLEPGLNLNIPIYHKIYKVDIRESLVQLPKQFLVTGDGVTINVEASVQYKVVDPQKSMLNVSAVQNSLVERSQMQLRNILSAMSVNDILHKRGDISQKIIADLKDLENDWGVKIISVQIKDISFDETMKRAMAITSEAQRNAEAKIIHANADLEIVNIYSKAAEIYKENPISLRLREFQLWNSISNNPNTTIYVVPSNICDFINKTKNKKQKKIKAKPFCGNHESDIPENNKKKFDENHFVNYIDFHDYHDHNSERLD
jgi:regulator of protease activity HflC (stomatin/prohibitin superfamily)